MPNYMDIHTFITWEHRKRVVDWMIKLCHARKHCPETLQLGVNVMDRFLSYRIAPLSLLQLVGLTSLWIAVKFQESKRVWTCYELVDLSLQQYKKEDFIQTELAILKTIDYKLSYPTPELFISFECDRLSDDLKEENALAFSETARFYVDMSLLDGRVFVGQFPEIVAKAAFLLAKRTMGLTFEVSSSAAPCSAE